MTAAAMVDELEYSAGCGCRKFKDAAWFSCDAHSDLHPGGWDSLEAYRIAWAHVQCCVCARYGFNGEDDFESVGMTGIVRVNPDGSLYAPLFYAHNNCAPLGRIFKDMQFHPNYRRRT